MNRRRQHRAKKLAAANSAVLADPSPSRYSRPVLRLVLEARNEYMVFRATFEKRDNVWKVLDCPDGLEWLKQTKADRLKLELLRRGFRWHWLGVGEGVE